MKRDENNIRVRFAPSPTGWLHIGGARTALFNFLIARRHGGAFLLRIEDTDTSRSNPEMTAAILRSLEWLGLTWDEPEVYQSAGRDIHIRRCLGLVEQGKAYRCFCTPEELQERRRQASGDAAYQYDGTCRHLPEAVIGEKLNRNTPFTVRFKTPPGETSFTDLVCGPVTVSHAEIGDFIILRSDGTPVYQVAVVSDDHDARVTHVIRGDDHLSNTPKQILLYRAFGMPVPEFAHVPMILGPDKKRLSKRHGAASVEEFRDAGVLPEALRNFLALLGWSPGDDREIMTLEEMIGSFSLDRISRNPAVFDEEKLTWMNSKYIQSATADDLIATLRQDPAVERMLAEAAADPAYIAGVLELLRPRMKRLTDFASQAGFFFHPPEEYEEQAVRKHWLNPDAKRRLRLIRNGLADLGSWTEEQVEELIRGAAEQEGAGAGKLIHPVRLALTGSSASPGIFEVIVLLGREEVVGRLDRALERLETPAKRH